MDNKIIDPRSSLRLAADHKRIEFRYTGISLQTPEHVRFRYQLQGFDNGWIDANTTRTASYSSVSPGAYTFRVLSSSNGAWNQTGASFSFVVVPPFYNTWWFSLLCIGTVITVATGGYQRKIRNIRARAEIASIERTRIAQEIHDTLLQGVSGASMQLAPLSGAIANETLRLRFNSALNEMQRYMAETRRALRDLSAPDIWGLGNPSDRRWSGPYRIDTALPSLLQDPVKSRALHTNKAGYCTHRSGSNPQCGEALICFGTQGSCDVSRNDSGTAGRRQRARF